MSKKIYRSLFDSDEVYEVEELTDEPTISTEGIAEVKPVDSGEPNLKQIWDVLNEIRDSLRGSAVKDNEPAEGNKVTKVDPEIDGSAPANQELADEEGKQAVEGGVEGEGDKEVKDSYSAFAGKAKQEEDQVSVIQKKFQDRYAAVANK